MNKACVLNLLFPIAGLIVLLSWRTGEGFEPESQAFFGWFVAGAVFQVAGALNLFRPTPRSWKRGWAMLWVAAAAYMGGYSVVYVGKQPVASDRADLYTVQAEPGKIAKLEQQLQALQTEEEARELRATVETRTAALEAKRTALAEKYPGRALDEGLRAELGVVENGYGRLEYAFALLFVAAFFSLAAFVTRLALETYRIRDPELEDPLAFKAQYGIQ